nr:hypothetical protein [Tanacetum cinerariifolium]
MVNTRTDTDLTAAVQNALEAMLPRIREEIREEFRTGSGSSNAVTVTWADFKKLFFLQFFPRAEQERLKREYHSIPAGTEEEQAKNFQWGLRRITTVTDLTGVVAMTTTAAATTISTTLAVTTGIPAMDVTKETGVI